MLSLIVGIISILFSFAFGYLVAFFLFKTERWEGDFNLICENGDVFPCHVNTSTITLNKIELTTSSGISKIILLDIPGGKLPLLEIGYGGTVHSYHLRRSGKNVILSLLKTAEPCNTPTDLMLSFEINNNKWAIFTVEITKKTR